MDDIRNKIPKTRRASRRENETSHQEKYNNTIRRAEKDYIKENYTRARKRYQKAKKYIYIKYFKTETFLNKLGSQKFVVEENEKNQLAEFANLCQNIAKTYIKNTKNSDEDKKLAAKEFELAADCYFALKQYDEAIEAYEASLKYNPHNDLCRTKLYQSCKHYKLHFPVTRTIDVKKEGSEELIEQKVDAVSKLSKEDVSVRKNIIFYFYPKLININSQKYSHKELLTATAITLRGARFTIKNIDNPDELVELYSPEPNKEKADQYCEKIADLLWHEKNKNKTTTKKLLEQSQYQFVRKAVLQKLQQKHSDFLKGCHECMHQLKEKYYKEMISALPDENIQKIYRAKLEALENPLCNEGRLHLEENDLILLGIDAKDFQLTDVEKSEYIYFQKKENTQEHEQVITEQNLADVEQQDNNTLPPTIISQSKNAKDIIDFVNKFIEVEKLISQLKSEPQDLIQYTDPLEYFTAAIANAKDSYENHCPWLKNQRISFFKWFNELIESILYGSSSTLSRQSSQERLPESTSSGTSSLESSATNMDDSKKSCSFFRTTSQKTIDAFCGKSTIELDKSELLTSNPTVLGH
jgi:hypothetical protein